MTHHNKVIILTKPRDSPGRWRLYGIRYPNGTQPVDVWFGQLSDEARFAMIDALKDAQKIDDPRNWLCFKRYLKGKYKQRRIWELWFSCGDKREYRLLGVFGSELKQAIFLCGCYHKGTVYTPASALDTAYKRAGDLAEKRATTYERKIPIDR